MIVMRCRENQPVNTQCCTASTNPSCSTGVSGHLSDEKIVTTHITMAVVGVRESHMTKKTQRKKQKTPTYVQSPPPNPTLSTQIGGTAAQFF